jgi:hypothetical protein
VGITRAAASRVALGTVPGTVRGVIPSVSPEGTCGGTGAANPGVKPAACSGSILAANPAGVQTKTRALRGGLTGRLIPKVGCEAFRGSTCGRVSGATRTGTRIGRCEFGRDGLKGAGSLI